MGEEIHETRLTSLDGKGQIRVRHYRGGSTGARFVSLSDRDGDSQFDIAFKPWGRPGPGAEIVDVLRACLEHLRRARSDDGGRRTGLAQEHIEAAAMILTGKRNEDHQ